MSSRRRTLVRTVAVTATVSGALLLPAAAAIADSATATPTATPDAAGHRGPDRAAEAPRGGVAAGAEDTAAGHPALLAVGGGMAAAGAAGLGFALLRRGRTDG